jgi:SAM-dependent methyltransferase
MNIKPDDFVLEIGSGHNPKPRSDVLCDKLPEDDTQRGGKIVRDRPFVAADGQCLPFADKSFDYIICCHVLEHADDPSLFLSELMRVGKAGYIETPTEIGEKLYGWEYHKWLFKLDDSGKLILKRKAEKSKFGQLFHQLFLTDPDYARFHDKNHNLFLIQCEWSEKIDYEIVENDAELIDLDNIENVNVLLKGKPHPSAFNSIKHLMPAWLRQWVLQGRSKKTLEDIKNIIVCPSCKSRLAWDENSIICNSCSRKYPIRNGIPFLLIK